MRVDVIVDRARSVDDMHHFEWPYLKTALNGLYGPFRTGRLK